MQAAISTMGWESSRPQYPRPDQIRRPDARLGQRLSPVRHAENAAKSALRRTGVTRPLPESCLLGPGGPNTDAASRANETTTIRIADLRQAPASCRRKARPPLGLATRPALVLLPRPVLRPAVLLRPTRLLSLPLVSRPTFADAVQGPAAPVTLADPQPASNTARLRLEYFVQSVC